MQPASTKPPSGDKVHRAVFAHDGNDDDDDWVAPAPKRQRTSALRGAGTPRMPQTPSAPNSLPLGARMAIPAFLHSLPQIAQANGSSIASLDDDDDDRWLEAIFDGSPEPDDVGADHDDDEVGHGSEADDNDGELEVGDAQEYFDDAAACEKDAFCPRCQVPLADLTLAHLGECLDTFRQPALACPSDASCKSTSLRHFLAFSHRQLALARSNALCPPQPPASTGLFASVQSISKQAKQAIQGTLNKFFQLPNAATTIVPSSPPAAKSCPFYKHIPDTPFTVDAFRFGSVKGCRAYFLSHFHSDHYGGLSKKWAWGPIYCSQVTANLVQTVLRVSASTLRVLPMHVTTLVEGVRVTLLEANHCPGAVLFLFELPNGRSILHTGDFRATEAMAQQPLLAGKTISALYLDTTYCDAKYDFPPQDEVIAFAVARARAVVQRAPRALFVVGTYTIGKERVFVAIAQALACKVYVTPEKRKILNCLADPTLSSLLTTVESEAQVHVVSIGQINHGSLAKYSGGGSTPGRLVVAFRPTGWTHSKSKVGGLARLQPTTKGTVSIFELPYSEHSSLSELKMFVQALRPAKILPTVNNGSAVNRGKMDAFFSSWLKS